MKFSRKKDLEKNIVVVLKRIERESSRWDSIVYLVVTVDVVA